MELKEEFNNLRNDYGLLLISMIKNKIPINEWSRNMFNKFSERERNILFGINLGRYYKTAKETELGNGTKLKNLRLILTKEKAALITWICTDGYLEVSKRGYYISIRDSDPSCFNYFKYLVNKLYGNTKISSRKIKNKNAHEARICSKKIVQDLITYIPLSGTRNWTIPIELLDKESIREVLKILTHAEGCAFVSNRRRAIEITLANPEVLIQTRYLFSKFGIETSNIRKDFSGGWKRYKIGIGKRKNLEKFQKEINFIPNTEKYFKFQKIMNRYKEYHNVNCYYILYDILKKNPYSISKELTNISNLNRSTVSRNLNKLKKIEKIDFIKEGHCKKWFIKIYLFNYIL